MGWTAPRTWVVGEVVTAALMNTHVRDNLNYFKGLAGAITISDVITCDGVTLTNGGVLSTSTENNDQVGFKAIENGDSTKTVARMIGGTTPRFELYGLNVQASAEIEIAAGVIDIDGMQVSEYSLVVQGGEGSGADDLDTINGGEPGDIIFIYAAHITVNDQVTIKDGTGNLIIAGDFTLTSFHDVIVLKRGSVDWHELSRSDNS